QWRGVGLDICDLELRMKILFIFTFYLVSAYSGGGVRIKCKYEEEHKTNNKYFCKGESTPCADQIKTGAKHTWVHEGRFSLYDNTIFWVVMRSLTVEDSGTYQCGVDIERWIDVYIPTVEMKVKAGEFSSLLLFFIILPLPTLFITLLNYLLSTIQNIKHELTDSQFMITQVWDSSVYLSKYIHLLAFISMIDFP
uniref:Immunoglobulin V-set domain-containing protein n=1 Tax=Electrophorus electricus TaxID=8005 RepID=A0AAY5E801_ELEEL